MNNNEEITTKELVLLFRKCLLELVSKWYLFIPIALFFSAFLFYQHFNYEATFNAQSKFIIEGQSGGGSLAGILGQIGIQRNSGKTNPYKVLEVTRSSVLAERVLFSKMPDGIIIANQIIADYDFYEKWKESTNKNLLGFVFKDSLNINDHTDMIAFKAVISLLWGSESNRENAICSINFREESGIFVLDVNSINEDLSLELGNNIYRNIVHFFEEEIFENHVESVNVLYNKMMKMDGEIEELTYRLSKFDDSSRNLSSSLEDSKKYNLQKDLQVKTAAFAEIVKMYELADYNLKDLKPMFMNIKSPMGPLSKTKSSLLIVLAKSAIFSFFLWIIWVLGVFRYREIMAS